MPMQSFQAPASDDPLLPLPEAPTSLLLEKVHKRSRSGSVEPIHLSSRLSSPNLASQLNGSKKVSRRVQTVASRGGGGRSRPSVRSASFGSGNALSDGERGYVIDWLIDWLYCYPLYSIVIFISVYLSIYLCILLFRSAHSSYSSLPREKSELDDILESLITTERIQEAVKCKNHIEVRTIHIPIYLPISPILMLYDDVYYYSSLIIYIYIYIN